MENQKLWSSTLSEIKQSVSASSFKTWFGGSKVLEYTHGDAKNILVVGVGSNFIKEQLTARYLSKLSEIISKKERREVDIVFVVSTGVGTKTVEGNAPIFSGIAENVITNGRKSDTLNFNHTFDNFVVGESNNIAYLAARQVAENLGSVYNPLLVFGPCGVGKTHLVQAIGNWVLAKYSNARVIYASSEKFTNDYIESLRNKTQAQFRQKYRSADLLIVDDIQFLGGKEGTQDEFFYTFNELYLTGKQLVIASDKHPRELGRIKERLISRFLGGMAASLGLADLELRTAILKMKCQQRGVMLSDEIAGYVAEAGEGGAREVEGLLISVLSLYKLSGGKISLEEIKKHLGQSVQIKTNVTRGEIMSSVCNYFGVSREQIEDTSRKAFIVYCRQVVMYLFRKHLKMSLSEIGDLLGGRDHSTVIHSIEKVENILLSSKDKNDEILRIEATF